MKGMKVKELMKCASAVILSLSLFSIVASPALAAPNDGGEVIVVDPGEGDSRNWYLYETYNQNGQKHYKYYETSGVYYKLVVYDKNGNRVSIEIGKV